MVDRPLYIADMTLFEFIHILGLINKINEKLSLKERKVQLKKEINSMLGTIPIDEGKSPRNLSSSRDKMIQNFMITLNQLDLLDDLAKTKNLYKLKQTDIEKFYQKLRYLLLYKGNLIEYIRVIEKVNQNKKINKNSQYLDEIAYEIYKKFPHISQAGHRKQVTYILKWLGDKKLGIFEIIDNKGLEMYKLKIKL